MQRNPVSKTKTKTKIKTKPKQNTKLNTKTKVDEKKETVGLKEIFKSHCLLAFVNLRNKIKERSLNCDATSHQGSQF